MNVTARRSARHAVWPGSPCPPSWPSDWHRARRCPTGSSGQAGHATERMQNLHD
jgi:hypothetical protein